MQPLAPVSCGGQHIKYYQNGGEQLCHYLLLSTIRAGGLSQGLGRLHEAKQGGESYGHLEQF